MRKYVVFMSTRKRKIQEIKIISCRFCFKIKETIFFFSESFSFNSRLIFLEDILCYSIPKHKGFYLKHVSEYSHFYTSLQVLVWLVMIFTWDKTQTEIWEKTWEKLILILSKRETFSTGCFEVSINWDKIETKLENMYVVLSIIIF